MIFLTSLALICFLSIHVTFFCIYFFDIQCKTQRRLESKWEFFEPAQIISVGDWCWRTFSPCLDTGHLQWVDLIIFFWLLLSINTLSTCLTLTGHLSAVANVNSRWQIVTSWFLFLSSYDNYRLSEIFNSVWNLHQWLFLFPLSLTS